MSRRSNRATTGGSNNDPANVLGQGATAATGNANAANINPVGAADAANVPARPPAAAARPAEAAAARPVDAAAARPADAAAIAARPADAAAAGIAHPAAQVANVNANVANAEPAALPAAQPAAAPFGNVPARANRLEPLPQAALDAIIDFPGLDPVADFNALLHRLGFNNATIAHLAAQSISNMDDLMNLRVSEVSEMIDLIGKFKESYVEASRRNPNDAVTFPYLAAKRLKALRLWGEYKKLRGEDADVSTYTEVMSNAWVQRLNELSMHDKQDKHDTMPKKLTNMTDWSVFDESLQAILGKLRSKDNGTPLTYLTRKHTTVSPTFYTYDWESIDQDMIHTVQHEGPTFENDSKTLFDIMQPALVDGPGWAFVKKYAKKQQGRDAYLTLQKQATGTSAMNAKKSLAYNQIEMAQYTGRSSKFTFDDYINRHVCAHNDLEECSEPVPEGRKVAVFLKGITDPRLSAAKDNVLGNDRMISNFQYVQQYLKTVLYNKVLNDGETPIRNASSASNQHDDHMPKQKGKSKANANKRTHNNSNNNTNGAVDKRYYTTDEYRNLNEKQKLALKVWRLDQEKKKIQDRLASCATTGSDENSDINDVASLPDGGTEVRHVSATSTERDSKTPAKKKPSKPARTAQPTVIDMSEDNDDTTDLPTESRKKRAKVTARANLKKQRTEGAAALDLLARNDSSDDGEYHFESENEKCDSDDERKPASKPANTRSKFGRKAHQKK